MWSWNARIDYKEEKENTKSEQEEPRDNEELSGKDEKWSLWNTLLSTKWKWKPMHIAQHIILWSNFWKILSENVGKVDPVRDVKIKKFYENK